MKKPKLSVIVPVYNVEKYISRCIESILSQNYDDFELILVDDGSTDNSGKICDEYANTDERIVVIHKLNSGVSESRNIGLKKAKGEYIGFVDSDDWIHPNMYNSIINEIDTGCFELGICGYKKISNFEELNNYKYQIIELNKTELLNEIYSISSKIHRTVWNKVFKKSLLLDQLFDESLCYCEDEKFLLEYIDKVQKAVFIDSEYYYYFEREGSATLGGVNTEKIFGSIDLQITHLNKIKKDYPEAYTNALLTYVDVWIYKLQHCQIKDHTDKKTKRKYQFIVSKYVFFIVFLSKVTIRTKLIFMYQLFFWI